MVEFSDKVKTTGREVVIKQKLWRDKIGAYMPDAAGPSPERDAFNIALAAFKEALREANPELQETDRMTVMSVHRFLKDIAEAEFGKVYAATNSPRPFNDAVSAEPRR